MWNCLYRTLWSQCDCSYKTARPLWQSMQTVMQQQCCPSVMTRRQHDPPKNDDTFSVARQKKKSRKQHHSDSYLHVAPHQRWTIETTQIILAFDAHDGMTRQHMFIVSLLTTTHSHCCSMSPDHTHNTHLHIPKTLNKTCVPRSALSIHVNQFRLKLLTPKIFVAHMGEEGMRYLFTSPLPHHIEQLSVRCTSTILLPKTWTEHQENFKFSNLRAKYIKSTISFEFCSVKLIQLWRSGKNISVRAGCTRMRYYCIWHRCRWWRPGLLLSPICSATIHCSTTIHKLELFISMVRTMNYSMFDNWFPAHRICRIVFQCFNMLKTHPRNKYFEEIKLIGFSLNYIVSK